MKTHRAEHPRRSLENCRPVVSISKLRLQVMTHDTLMALPE
ncbi:MAG TPA: hypothetical protein VNN22_20625 [Verrucomicrobiae bacterium]|nr:hypothetical protein [Verrucomicrobiae bacterium]